MESLLTIIACYFLGAIPFGLIISRLAGIEDIRSRGSGNIGATNVWRVAGAKAAIWVYIADIGKGVAAILLARYILDRFSPVSLPADTFLVICALVTIAGHIFPVYLKFRGGKGVNTALGVVMTLLPRESLISLLLFALVLILTRFVSLGSIVASVGLFLTIVTEKYFLSMPIATIYVYMSSLLAGLIIITHRQNIGRLLTGNENRISFRN